MRYVHGHDDIEHERLRAQAATLTELLHAGTHYPPGSRVLEAGCGAGAQTLELARRSPGAHIVAADISPDALAAARQATAAAGLRDIEFAHADLLAPPFAPGSFDHVFVCFVLEHLTRPEQALAGLVRLLRPGGTLTLVEGDHGSVLLHPDDPDAHAALACLVELQRRAGGDALIGRRLRPLLSGAGLEDVRVLPRLVHVDAARPELAEDFTRRTFAAMVAGVRGPALEAGLIEAPRFDAGLRALERSTQPDGLLDYTFFKGTGVKPTARGRPCWRRAPRGLPILARIFPRKDTA